MSSDSDVMEQRRPQVAVRRGKSAFRKRWNGAEVSYSSDGVGQRRL